PALRGRALRPPRIPRLRRCRTCVSATSRRGQGQHLPLQAGEYAVRVMPASRSYYPPATAGGTDLSFLRRAINSKRAAASSPAPTGASSHRVPVGALARSVQQAATVSIFEP